MRGLLGSGYDRASAASAGFREFRERRLVQILEGPAGQQFAPFQRPEVVSSFVFPDTTPSECCSGGRWLGSGVAWPDLLRIPDDLCIINIRPLLKSRTYAPFTPRPTSASPA